MTAEAAQDDNDEAEGQGVTPDQEDIGTVTQGAPYAPGAAASPQAQKSASPALPKPDLFAMEKPEIAKPDLFKSDTSEGIGEHVDDALKDVVYHASNLGKMASTIFQSVADPAEDEAYSSLNEYLDKNKENQKFIDQMKANNTGLLRGYVIPASLQYFKDNVMAPLAFYEGGVTGAAQGAMNIPFVGIAEAARYSSEAAARDMGKTPSEQKNAGLEAEDAANELTEDAMNSLGFTHSGLPERSTFLEPYYSEALGNQLKAARDANAQYIDAVNRYMANQRDENEAYRLSDAGELYPSRANDYFDEEATVKADAAQKRIADRMPDPYSEMFRDETHEKARAQDPEAFEMRDRLESDQALLRDHYEAMREDRDQKLQDLLPHEDEIAELEAKKAQLKTTTSPRARQYQARIDELKDAQNDFMEAGGRTLTPEMTALRDRMLANQNALLDLGASGRIPTAYRKADLGTPDLAPWAEEKTPEAPEEEVYSPDVVAKIKAADDAEAEFRKEEERGYYKDPNTGEPLDKKIAKLKDKARRARTEARGAQMGHDIAPLMKRIRAAIDPSENLTDQQKDDSALLAAMMARQIGNLYKPGFLSDAELHRIALPNLKVAVRKVKELTQRRPPPVEDTPELSQSAAPLESVEANISAAQADHENAAIRHLTELARGGNEQAHDMLNRFAENTLRRLLSGIPSVKIDTRANTGLYGGNFEPSISASILFDPADKPKVLAALAHFAKLYQQEQIHVMSHTDELRPTFHEKGRYTIPVTVYGLKRPLTREEMKRISDESGITGLSANNKELTVYYDGDPTDTGAIDAHYVADSKIRSTLDVLGAGTRSAYRGLTELGIYGRGDAARPYADIAGEIRTPLPEGDPNARAVAERYLGEPINFQRAAKRLDDAQTLKQRMIADEYERLPDNDMDNPLVKRAYEEAAHEIKEQFKSLPIKVEAWKGEGEPYKKSGKENASDAMRRDVIDNHHMWYFPTTKETFGPKGVDFTGHPLLEPSGIKDASGHEMLTNDLLRVVHDYYAHTTTPNQFGPLGEEAAWQNHMRTIKSPLARWAITSETRGQNSWVNFNPDVFGKDIPIADRPFARQKAALLPLDWAKTGDEAVDRPINDLEHQLTPEQAKGSLKGDRAAPEDFPGRELYQEGETLQPGHIYDLKGFYSALYNGIRGLKDETGTPEEWMRRIYQPASIKKDVLRDEKGKPVTDPVTGKPIQREIPQPEKSPIPGVSVSEVYWSGLTDWLQKAMSDDKSFLKEIEGRVKDREWVLKNADDSGAQEKAVEEEKKELEFAKQFKNAEFYHRGEAAKEQIDSIESSPPDSVFAYNGGMQSRDEALQSARNNLKQALKGRLTKDDVLDYFKNSKLKINENAFSQKTERTKVPLKQRRASESGFDRSQYPTYDDIEWSREEQREADSDYISSEQDHYEELFKDTEDPEEWFKAGNDDDLVNATNLDDNGEPTDETTYEWDDDKVRDHVYYQAAESAQQQQGYEFSADIGDVTYNAYYEPEGDYVTIHRDGRDITPRRIHANAESVRAAIMEDMADQGLVYDEEYVDEKEREWEEEQEREAAQAESEKPEPGEYDSTQEEALDLLKRGEKGVRVSSDYEDAEFYSEFDHPMLEELLKQHPLADRQFKVFDVKNPLETDVETAREAFKKGYTVRLVDDVHTDEAPERVETESEFDNKDTNQNVANGEAHWEFLPKTAEVEGVHYRWETKKTGTVFWPGYQMQGGKRGDYHEVVIQLPGISSGNTPSHGFGPSKNMILHMRFSERMDDEGKKTLYIEEIQSDWGAALRKMRKRRVDEVRKQQNLTRAEAEKLVPEDYGLLKAGERGTAKAEYEALASQRTDLQNKLTENLLDRVDRARMGVSNEEGLEKVKDVFSAEKLAEIDPSLGGYSIRHEDAGNGYRWHVYFGDDKARSFVHEKDAARNLAVDASNQAFSAQVANAAARADEEEEFVPQAPFMDAQDYIKLALKRAILWGTHNGFEKIAWTPGWIQNERWSGMLRSVVDRIDILNKDEVAKEGGPAAEEDGVWIRISNGGSDRTNFLLDRGGALDEHEHEGKDYAFMTKEALSNLIGDTMADKIMEKAKEPQKHLTELPKGTEVHFEPKYSDSDISYFRDNVRNAKKHLIEDGESKIRLESLEKAEKNLTTAEKSRRDEVGTWRIKDLDGISTPYVGVSKEEALKQHLKILNRDEGGRSITGDDITFESKGMLKAYDQMTASIAKDIIKKYGGKLETSHFSGFTSTSEGSEPISRQGAIPHQSFSLTPEMKESVQNTGLPLFQPKRGSYALGTRSQKAAISLLEAHNVTTLMHEMGHHYLEALNEAIKSGGATDQAKADFDEIMKWTGIKGDTPETRHQTWNDMVMTNSKKDPKRVAHEKFADGILKFLHEGVAPTKELVPVFQRMKTWFKKVYDLLTREFKDLPALTPQMRDVYSRLFSDKPGNFIPEEPGREMANVHEADAETTHPDHAAEVANLISDEVSKTAEAHNPEVKDGLERAASGDTQKGGVSTEPPAGQFDAQPSEVHTRRAEAEGESSTTERPDSPYERKPRQSRFFDLAGNIRLENLTTNEDVKELLREYAKKYPELYNHERWTQEDMTNLADAMGVHEKDINIQLLRETTMMDGIPLAVRIKVGRRMLVQSAAEFKKIASEYDHSPAAQWKLAEARQRFLMISETVSKATSEWGRAGHGFRDISKEELNNATVLSQLMQQYGDIKPQEIGKLAQLVKDVDANPAEAARALNDSSKPGWGRMIVEYRENCLLSGQWTHTRYSIGNEIQQFYHPLAEMLPAALLGAVREAFGKETGDRVYLREIPAQLFAIGSGSIRGLQAAAKNWKNSQEGLLPGQKPYEGRFAHTGVIPGKIGAAYRLPSKVVQALHTFGSTVRYTQEISGLAVRAAINEGLTGSAFDDRVAQLSAYPTPAMMEIARSKDPLDKAAVFQALSEGLKEEDPAFFNRVDELKANPTPQMRQQAEQAERIKLATQRALKHMFMEPTDYNTAMGKLQAYVNSQPLVKSIIPFMKIGINIEFQGLVEGTPLAIPAAAVNKGLRENLLYKKGGAAGDEQWAKIAAGTGLMAFAGSMLQSGYMTGDGPEDPKDREAWMMQIRALGAKPRSIRIGNMWFSYRGLGKIGAPLALAANLYETGKYMRPEEQDNAAAMYFETVSKVVMDDNFMYGISQMMDAIYHAKEYGETRLRDFATSWLPWSVGMSQTAQSIDPYQRDARSMVDAVKKKVPFMSEELHPRIDVFGNPMASESSQAAYEGDPTITYLGSLGAQIGAPKSRTIDGVKLNNDQWEEFQTKSGKLLKLRLDAMVNTKGFRQMPQTEQMKLISDTVYSTRQQVRQIMIMQHKDIRDAIVAKKRLH